MDLTVSPLALVAVAAGPSIGATAMPLTVSPPTLIAAAAGPSVDAKQRKTGPEVLKFVNNSRCYGIYSYIIHLQSSHMVVKVAKLRMWQWCSSRSMRAAAMTPSPSTLPHSSKPLLDVRMVEARRGGR